MQGFIILTMKIDFLKALSSYRLGLKKARFYTNKWKGLINYPLLWVCLKVSIRKNDLKPVTSE
jgi:hypothetical protein